MADDNTPAFVLNSDVWALIRHQHELDYAAAGPKAPAPSILYRGIRLESRWSVVSELNDMKRIVDAVPEILARRLASIWCDSNCGANYLVMVRDGMWEPELEWAISKAALEGGGGHNGVMIEEEGGGTLAILDPDWGEADL